MGVCESLPGRGRRNVKMEEEPSRGKQQIRKSSGPECDMFEEQEQKGQGGCSTLGEEMETRKGWICRAMREWPMVKNLDFTLSVMEVTGKL